MECEANHDPATVATAKRLYSEAQGRVSAPWVVERSIRPYAEGVIQGEIVVHHVKRLRRIWLHTFSITQGGALLTLGFGVQRRWRWELRVNCEASLPKMVRHCSRKLPRRV